MQCRFIILLLNICYQIKENTEVWLVSSKITGKEYSLSKNFSKEFDYYIPAYQGPYAWSQEETEILFEDLYDFLM